MRKTLSNGWKALSLSWKANGIFSIVILLGKLYDSTLYPFIQVFLLAQALDIFAQKSSLTLQDLSPIIFVYLGASVLKLLIGSLTTVMSSFLQICLEAYVDLQISQKLTELDPAVFENPDFQNLLSQLESVKTTIQLQLERSIELLDALFKFATATIVVAAIFPFFAPIILIATIPSYLLWNKIRDITFPFYIEKRSPVSRVTEYVKNLLSSDSTSKEVIIFQTEDTLIGKVKNEQKKYFTAFSKVNNQWIFPTFLARLVQFSAFVFTQFLTLSKVFAGSITIGQFALIFQQSLNLTFSAESILNNFSSISARNKYFEVYLEFMSLQKVIRSSVSPIPVPTDPAPPVIEFKNVSFKYPKTDREILKDFNLIIKSGEKIAFVGENGAGKTTLIKLLLRFYDVTEGEILLNGINIKDINPEEWHKQIGALFQDFIKYQFTFKENVYLGDVTKKNREDLLRDAIEKSGADRYVDTLPDSIDQVVGKMFDGGIDLSGGQWQKLALARAFFRDAPVLVLDEPTSAIDAKAEAEIFENVQKLQKDKTVVIISHRFSTVRHADRILVLTDGTILEEGSHDALMKKKGLYHELFNIQAQGYK